MKRYFAFFLLAVFVTACQTEQVSDAPITAIQNITIIDADQGTMSNQTVLLQDGKIKTVGQAEEIEVPEGASIIDGNDKYLIPGLWDTHVHFAYIEEMAPYMFDLFLAYGITSVRDTGGKILFVKDWKDQAEADPTNAPRVKIAGPLLDGMPNVYDGSTPQRPPLSVGLATVEDAVNMVDYLDSLGVDLVKAYEMLTPEQFEAVVARAQEKGLKITGHIPLSMDAISAAKTGINSMEHLRNLEFTMSVNSDDLLAERRQLLQDGQNDEGGILRSRIHTAQRTRAIQTNDEVATQEVIAALAENGNWQVPTLALSTGNMIDRPFVDSNYQEVFKYLPTKIEDQWKASIETFAVTPVTENAKIYGNWALETINRMNQSGVGIMAGTDCPIFFLLPGLSLHEELVMLVRAGLTAAEALEAATLSPAKYFDMESELGLIKEGYLADLLILEANPLEDIRNTQKINSVIRAGKVMDRAALDAKLARLDAGL